MRLLFIGGCKSGKSSTAQRMARALACGKPMYYWATLEPRDGEDRAIVRRHLAERDGWGFETIEQEFAGHGYGDFKQAVGESVVELLRPIREETERLLADKSYLESVYRAGAEKAAYVANRTLNKVYKKVGFLPR